MINFQPTEEQQLLRDLAADVAAHEIAPYALEWDQNRHFPVDALRKLGTLGFGGIYASEAVGGGGATRLDAAMIFEELAKGCPTIAAFVSIHNMCVWMIDRFGDDAQRRQYGPALASLEHIASYCLTEPGCGSDAAALTTRAVRASVNSGDNDSGDNDNDNNDDDNDNNDDDYILTGRKQFISGAGESDVYLIMARTGAPGPKGISAFLVDKDAPGLSFGVNERKMGWSAQPTRAVILDGVRVPASARLGAEGDGFKIAMAGLDGGRVNIAACSLGGAQDALNRTLAYMRERTAFGQALADMPALQMRLADMATDLEVSRTMLWRAAAALDAGAADATTLCAMAKRFVTDAGFRTANEALQLHGGYGYLCDYGVEKIVRDLRVHQILEGTNEIMRVIIARAL